MLYRNILFLLAFMLVFRATSILATPGFFVQGELTLTIPARQLLKKISENPKDPFTIYVYQENSTKPPAYTKDIELGQFRFPIPLSIPETDILLRALHGDGLISTKDVILTRAELENLRNQRGNPLLQGVVITITTLTERYFREMQTVDTLVNELRFHEALVLLKEIQEQFLPAGNEFLYRVLQRRVEIIHSAFMHGKILEELDLPFVHEFSEGFPAATLTPTQQYKLLLQYIRAVRKSPYKPTWQMSTGDRISDIVDEAFTKCIHSFLQTDRDPKEAAGLAQEYLNHLSDTNKYFKLVEIGGKYFDFMHFPEHNLKDYERKSIVVTLVAMGDALALGTNLNSFTTTEYVDEVKESSEAQKAWKIYMKHLEGWKKFFPSNSNKIVSRRVNRYYSVGKSISEYLGGNDYE